MLTRMSEFLFLLVFCVLSFACSGSNSLSGIEASSPELKPDDWRAAGGNAQTASDAVQQFAVDVYGEIEGLEGNVAFSPYSIMSCLALALEGAEGDTYSEMARAMKLIPRSRNLSPSLALLNSAMQAPQKQDNAGWTVDMANGLFPQEKYALQNEYVETIRKFYRAALQEMDYVNKANAAAGKINEWVEKMTRGKIEKLIQPSALNAQTRLVLVNAIYFYGEWMDPFSDKATKEEAFYVNANKTVEAPLMMRMGNYYYMENKLLQAIELPYKGNVLSMVLILPKEKGGLDKVEQALSVSLLKEIYKGLWQTRVMVYVPHFKARSRMQLVDVLKRLGMDKAFSMDADFSKMTGKPDLFISAVMHEAVVEVDEKGAEAAAATGVVMATKAVGPRVEKPITFRADHPFLYVIRHRETGAILFMGRITNPVE